MAASMTACGNSDSSSKKSKKSDDSSVLQTEDSSKTETESNGDSKSEDSSKDDESVPEESTPVESEPETTSEPVVTTPTDSDDEKYDPNKHHVPLPQVDVTGKNWTQTPDGWLDEAKGSASYKYFNKDKWDEYTGENDPNFPNGDPAVE